MPVQSEVREDDRHYAKDAREYEGLLGARVERRRPSAPSSAHHRRWRTLRVALETAIRLGAERECDESVDAPKEEVALRGRLLDREAEVHDVAPSTLESQHFWRAMGAAWGAFRGDLSPAGIICIEVIPE